MRRVIFAFVFAGLASIIFYCGTAVRTVNDAIAQDASLLDGGTPDSGVVCDCPPAPVCESCVTKIVYTGIVVTALELITLGTIPNFNPDSEMGMPTIQRWYFDAANSRWVQISYGVYISDTGVVTLQSNSEEYVNREFRIILMWAGNNPRM